MNLLQKIIRTPIVAWKAIKRVWARYEAAIWTWGNRSYIFGSNQDARLDADSMSRREIMRKSRYFERNNAFVNRLADIFEQYTVGASGLQLVSESKDATDYFNRWADQCDCTGLMTFCTMQSVIARAWFVDGEIFVIRVNLRGMLKIQLIESHRVYTPPHLSSQEGINVIDGVGIDGNGRVLGIWVNTAQSPSYASGFVTSIIADTDSPANWKFVEAEDVIHVFEPNRANMYRGLPFLYPVMNDLHDLDDLQVLTMQVAKQAATLGNVTTNRTGEFDTLTSRRQKLAFQSTNADALAISKTAGEFYNVQIGAAEIALQKGDSIKQFQAERPSLAEREHWDYLLSKVCAGVGISKLLVLPYSMQGTVARADLAIAAAFFRARSSIIQAAIRQVFFWALEWGGNYDREVFRGGFDFTNFENVTVRPPKSPDVDVGRNSKALISEYQAGLRTAQDIFGEAGQDWREQFEQKAREAQLINELAKEYEVEPDDIAQRLSSASKDSGDGEDSEEEDGSQQGELETKTEE